MPERKASETKRGGDSKAEGLKAVLRAAVEQFGTLAVSEAFSEVKLDRQEVAAEEAKQAIIDLTASGEILTLAAERKIIEQTGVDRRTYQGVLNSLIWQQQKNETGILDFKGRGFGVRVTAKEMKKKFLDQKALLPQPQPVIPEVAVTTKAAPISKADQDRARQFVFDDVQAAGTTRYEDIYARGIKAGINRFAILGAILGLANDQAIEVESKALGHAGGKITIK